MRRALPIAVALSVAVATATLAPATASTIDTASKAMSSSAPVLAKKQVKTPYVMGASAYGTRVNGGAIPAGSSETGYMVMGCNRIANKSRTNFVATVNVPGLGTIDGIRTRVWTEKRGNRVSSIARHTVAAITLADTPLGSLAIAGIESRSEAFHKNGRYGAKVENNIAKIVFDPAAGPPVTIPIPAPGAPITIPGLAKISIGKSSKSTGRDFALAQGTVIRIQVFPTDTVVVVGRTKARLELAQTRGLFNGFGAGVLASILDETAQAGRTAYQPIPCIGTQGKDIVKALASADLDPLGTVGAVGAGVNARRKGKGAIAKAAGQVADISLGEGALEIQVVTGVATVRRTNSGSLIRSSKGTHVGQIIANGTPYDLDQLGELEIPGLAKLQGKVVQKFRNGMKVIGLRVTLLDGSLAVVDLGVAKAKIRPTKKK